MTEFSDEQQMERTMSVHGVLQIHVNLLSDLGVTVELASESPHERHSGADHAGEFLASSSCYDNHVSQVSSLSATNKVVLLKSIAEAIKRTWAARPSHQDPLPNPGLFGTEMSPIPGTRTGAS